jgi:hypothetical protein
LKRARSSPISAGRRAPVSAPTPGKLVMIAASGVPAEGLGGGGLQVLCVLAGGVELAQQGQGLAAHGLFDEGQLPHLGGAERTVQPGGLGVDALAAAGLAQQAAQRGGQGVSHPDHCTDKPGTLDRRLRPRPRP